ncbi:hypothetical protein LCGC14_1756140, partial [marine sediment metagenome]
MTDVTKTKAELIDELAALRQHVATVEGRPPGGPSAEQRRIEHALRERVKELNCLYGITETVDRCGDSLDELLQEGVERERATLLRYLDMRYVGQHHEVTVEIPHNCAISEVHLEQIAASFHAAHELLYTYSMPETALEL